MKVDASSDTVTPFRFVSMSAEGRVFEEGTLLFHPPSFNGDPLSPFLSPSLSPLPSPSSSLPPSLLSRLRRWLTHEDFLLSRSFHSPPNSISIVQWNTLADRLSDAFPRVSAEFLTWTHRFPLLVGEMRKFVSGGGVVCLEEVDHFPDLEREMADLAVGFFAAKDVDDVAVDGCAMFIPKGEWEVIGLPQRHVLTPGVHVCVFLISYTLHYESTGNILIISLFHTFSPFSPPGASQVALAVALRRVCDGTRVSLVTAHFKAKVGFESVRRQQALRVCEISQETAASFSFHSPGPVISVVACDMNDIPSSAAADVMRERGFTSAYASIDAETYTTSKIRQERVTRCIDYIWMSEDCNCEAVLSIPPLEKLGNYLQFVCGHF